MSEKEYLGDGVSVYFDGYQLWLTVENGITVTNQIALDIDVYKSLVFLPTNTTRNHQAMDKPECIERCQQTQLCITASGCYVYCRACDKKGPTVCQDCVEAEGCPAGHAVKLFYEKEENESER